MTESTRIILVTGATGRQGGAVIRHLLPRGWKLRALTRKTDGAAAKQLVAQGVEVVKGDLEDPASVVGATRGAYGVYSVQDFWSALRTCAWAPRCRDLCIARGELPPLPYRARGAASVSAQVSSAFARKPEAPHADF